MVSSFRLPPELGLILIWTEPDRRASANGRRQTAGAAAATPAGPGKGYGGTRRGALCQPTSIAMPISRLGIDDDDRVDIDDVVIGKILDGGGPVLVDIDVLTGLDPHVDVIDIIDPDVDVLIGLHTTALIDIGIRVRATAFVVKIDVLLDLAVVIDLDFDLDVDGAVVIFFDVDHDVRPQLDVGELLDLGVVGIRALVLIPIVIVSATAAIDLRIRFAVLSDPQAEFDVHGACLRGHVDVDASFVQDARELLDFGRLVVVHVSSSPSRSSMSKPMSWSSSEF